MTVSMMPIWLSPWLAGTASAGSAFFQRGTSAQSDTMAMRNDTLGHPPDTGSTSLPAVGKDTSVSPANGAVVHKDTLDIITSDASFNTVPGFAFN